MIKKLLAALILILLFTTMAIASSEGVKTLQEQIAKSEKEALANSKVMLQIFKKKRIPVYIEISCENTNESMNIKNKVIRVLSKKLIDLGDVIIVNTDGQSAFAFRIAMLYNKPLNQVLMSIVITHNSVSYDVITSKKPTKEIPTNIYENQWVTQNPLNGFSTNLDNVVDYLNAEFLQTMRKFL